MHETESIKQYYKSNYSELQGSSFVYWISVPVKWVFYCNTDGLSTGWARLNVSHTCYLLPLCFLKIQSEGFIFAIN